MRSSKDKTGPYTGIRLSASSINTFRRCPREFYYSYVLRLPQPPSIHLLKGNIVHSVLEKFFQEGYEENLTERAGILLNAEWENRINDVEDLKLSPTQQEIEKTDCSNMLDMYVKSFLTKIEYMLFAGKAKDKKHAFNLLKPRFREKFYESEAFNVCGYVDRINVDFDGEVTISDYKTSNRYGTGIKYDYILQCGIYALLYKENEGKIPDYASVIFLRFGEEVMTRITPDLISETIDVIKDTENKTRTDNIDNYHKNEGKFCKWCSYFDKCSGMEKIKDDQRVADMMKEIEKREKA